MPTAYDPLTGWNFDYVDVSGRPPPGGLVLTNMKHWGHNFCRDLRLIISQRFLFSPYDHIPRHEPSGGLNAARCHPMTRFDFHRNDSVDMTRNRWRFARMRFDYRLHLFLDRHHTSPSTQPNIGNNAGLFRDNESAGAGPVVQAGRTVLVLIDPVPQDMSSISQGFSNIAFGAIEKPLIREVATVGLNQGTTRFRDANTWDNVHW